MIKQTSDLVQRALTEPDGKKAFDIYAEIARVIRAILEDYDILEFNAPLILPDDTGKGGSQRKAHKLSGLPVPNLYEEFQEEASSSSCETSNSSANSAEQQPTTSDDDNSNENTTENEDNEGEGDTTDDSDEFDPEILNELEKEINNEKKELPQIEFDINIGESGVHVFVSRPDYYDWKRFNEGTIRTIGNVIARNFQTILRERTKSKYKPGYKSGRLHSKSLWKLSKTPPDYRVFKRKGREMKLNYQCFILIDRSGSMDGQDIYHAVYATLVLCYALEQIGIQTEVYGFYEKDDTSKIMVHKVLDENFEIAKYKIATLYTGWGTPTHMAMKVVKSRINKIADKNPFIIIVTDGLPNNTWETVQEIKTCPYPVIGVTIGYSGKRELSRIYHAEVNIGSSSDLLPALTQLVRKLMF